jgi:hypothetical protein
VHCRGWPRHFGGKLCVLVFVVPSAIWSSSSYKLGGIGMSLEAVWEAAFFVTMAAALALVHVWKDKRVRQRHADAKEVLRLREIREGR